MTLKEAINELKAMKPQIEPGMSIVRYDAYDMAIRGLELWDMYAEEVDDVYEDGKGETYLIREWIEDGGGTTETVKPTAESSQNVPNTDLISRKAAIEALKEAFNPSITNFVKAKIAIDKLPSAQPEQRWIPVTESLPREDDYRPCYGYEDGAVWWRNDMGLMGLGWYYPSTGMWAYYDELERCDKGVGNVVAWMHLPEPAKLKNNLWEK